MHIEDKYALCMTREEWEAFDRQGRAVKKGHSLGGLGLVGLKRVLYESVATEDEDRRYGLIKGYSQALSERVFPVPKTDALSRSVLSAVNAQWQYEHGMQKVLTEAVNAARESRTYQRLDIQRFLEPPQRPHRLQK